MKVLTATASTQGRRDNDFHWCVEGELVSVGLVCASDRGSPDGRCGCGRSFAGMSSHRATTTAMVRELEGLSRSEYLLAFSSSMAAQGWDPEVADEADELLRLADEWPVGTVVERRLDRFFARSRLVA